MTKRYQRGNQEGTNQRRTDNTRTKRSQRGNQEGTNQSIVSPSLIYGFWITSLVSLNFVKRNIKSVIMDVEALALSLLDYVLFVVAYQSTANKNKYIKKH
jgi:hypothetical protein